MFAKRPNLDRGGGMCFMQCLGDAVLGNGGVPMGPHEQPSRVRIRGNGWKVHARAGHAVEQCPVDHVLDNADNSGPRDRWLMMTVVQWRGNVELLVYWIAS